MLEKQWRLFDTHCHIDREDFSGDVAKELNVARALGVDAFLIPGCGVFNWDRIEAISSLHTGVYFSLGMHPYYLDLHLDEHLSLLNERLLQRSEQCVAVGECGLDFYLTRDDESIQKFFFIEQVRLANKYQLPLILHSRKAHQDVIKQLKLNKVTNGGVIHGFTGSYEQAMDYIRLGFFIGVGGSITYPRAKKTRDAISKLPLETLVLETDSPDMPIFGRQGRKNHPKKLKNILDELIVLRSEAEQTIAHRVYENSKKMYGI